MKKKSTIYDISALAEVSIATVSRVVNDDPSVRDKTRQKVLEAMSMLRYRPSQSAKAMAEKRDTVLVGVLYRFASSGYFAELLKGIDQGLLKKDCLMLASRLQQQPTSVEEIKKYIKISGVQALIILYPDLSPEFLEFAKRSSLPLVVIGEHLEEPNIHQIISNNTSGLKKLVQAIIKKHPRPTVVIHGPNDNSEAQERLDVTQKVLSKQGLEHHLLNGDFQGPTTKKVLTDWLKKNPSPFPINIICHNDTMALSVMALVYQRGLRIPEDVSISGHDDIESSETFGLSTVRVATEQIGLLAAEKAMRLLKYEDTDLITTVETQVIKRTSY